jgi:hypothetical protein
MQDLYIAITTVHPALIQDPKKPIHFTIEDGDQHILKQGYTATHAAALNAINAFVKGK